MDIIEVEWAFLDNMIKMLPKLFRIIDQNLKPNCYQKIRMMNDLNEKFEKKTKFHSYFMP